MIKISFFWGSKTLPEYYSSKYAAVEEFHVDDDMTQDVPNARKTLQPYKGQSSEVQSIKSYPITGVEVSKNGAQSHNCVCRLGPQSER